MCVGFFADRYQLQIIDSTSGALPIRIDKWTGKTWVIKTKTIDAVGKDFLGNRLTTTESKWYPVSDGNATLDRLVTKPGIR